MSVSLCCMLLAMSSPPKALSHPPPIACCALLYTQDFQQQQHHHLASTAGGQPSLEPSAVAGILSERFCCGPQLSAAQLQDPYYGSELGQVFFPPNAWPDVAVPQLQPQMLQCYSQCEVIAAALMRLFAAALGVEQGFFDKHLARHHSNMQVRVKLLLLPSAPCISHKHT